jgi:SAM-dependent methyltransferase
MLLSVSERPVSLFNQYAQYYDHFYADKDYDAECDFLENIFGRYATKTVHSVLDLGCGTGGHLLPLGRRGYDIAGVDRSEIMLAAARRKIAELPAHLVQGDVRTINLGRTFDVVISMFAVMSYMTTTTDLLDAFRTARRHLTPGGLFCFDAWSGIAVLSERPSDRFKIIEKNGNQIIRLVHPELDLIRHLVQVNYRVLQLQQGQLVQETTETHTMRYLFPQEIAFLLSLADLRVVKLCPFMNLDRQLSEHDWNLAVVAEAVGNDV